MPKQNKNSHIHYHDDIEQGTDKWKEQRKFKITGSTAYRLLGKVLPRLSTFNNGESTFTGNFATRRGQLLEPEAVGLYEQIKGVKVLHTGFVTNDKYPNCLYSPDGYLDDRTIEVKCFYPKHHLEAIVKPDTHILAQCYFGQIILEKPLTDLIFYCPKNEIPVEKMLVIKSIPAKDKVHANIIRRIEAVNERG